MVGEPVVEDAASAVETEIITTPEPPLPPAAAEALARAEGDQAVQNAMKDIQAFLENAIKEEITNLAVERVNQVRGLRQKGNIPVPSSSGGQWNVQGGVD